jgi:hypothetical protein
VRLSPFDADHAATSFALVEVMPQAEGGADITINPEDLRIDVFRASGHGGQNVQKNATAVRITHVPTGIVASCQNERSQYRNRESAMRVLEARLLERELDRQAEEQARIKGEHVSAGWGNQIRSYVLHPYKMVKDHRTASRQRPRCRARRRPRPFMEAYLKMTMGEERALTLLFSMAGHRRQRHDNAVQAVEAQSGVVIATDAENDFPNGVNFSASLHSDVDLSELKVTLRYTIAPDGASVYEEPQCNGGTEVECTYNLKSGPKLFLGPGANVDYYWQIDDAGGNSIMTQPTTFVYDDTRFDWKTMTDGNLTVRYYSSDESDVRSLLETGVEGLQRMEQLLNTKVGFPVKVFLYAPPKTCNRQRCRARSRRTV